MARQRSGFQKFLFQLQSNAVGRCIVRFWRWLSNLWGLRLKPRLERIVLPGCAGIPAWDIVRHFSNRDLWHTAKALSYSFLMAVPPLLIFLFSLIAYLPFNGIQDELLIQLQGIIPENFYDKVSETVNDVMGHKHSSLLSIGFIGSIVLAANGMNGLLQSFNSVNRSIEWRSIVHRYLLSICLVFLFYLLIVVILMLLIGYKHVIAWLIGRNIVARSKVTLIMFSFGRWVILTLFTLLVVSIVYYIAPVKKQRMNFFSIGSVLATLLFFALSWGFQVYLNSFNNFNILYGSIGTLLMIMLWLYANCVVLLAGYSLNITIANDKNNLYYHHNRIKRQENVRRITIQTRYALRTDKDGYRQRLGSDVWFGTFGSVRHTSARGSDGANSSANR